MSAERPKIRIQITCDSVLSVDEVWPDGDAPEVIDEASARAKIGGLDAADLLDEWNLGIDAEVSVAVEPAAPAGKGERW